MMLVMKFEDPLNSKIFFKAQWNKPFQRLRKTALPIIVSGFAAFLIISCFFAFLPWFVGDGGDNLMTILNVVLAVIMGVSVAFLGHLIHLRGTSRFETIKVRVRSKNGRDN